MITMPPTRVYKEGISLKISNARILANIGSLKVDTEIIVDETYLTI
jgi:hypothetical protein